MSVHFLKVFLLVILVYKVKMGRRKENPLLTPLYFIPNYVKIRTKLGMKFFLGREQKIPSAGKKFDSEII